MEKGGIKIFRILLVFCIATEAVLGELTNFLGSDFERPLVRRWGNKKSVEQLQVIKNYILQTADTDPCSKLDGENIKGDKDYAIIPNTECKNAFDKLLKYYKDTVPISCQAGRSPKCTMNPTTNSTLCMIDQYKECSILNCVKKAIGKTTLKACAQGLTMAVP